MDNRKPATTHVELIAAAAELTAVVTQLRTDVAALQAEVASLRTIRDQGKGWLGALTFAAAIVGSALTAAIGHFWPGA